MCVSVAFLAKFADRLYNKRAGIMIEGTPNFLSLHKFNGFSKIHTHIDDLFGLIFFYFENIKNNFVAKQANFISFQMFDTYEL